MQYLISSCCRGNENKHRSHIALLGGCCLKWNSRMKIDLEHKELKIDI